MTDITDDLEKKIDDYFRNTPKVQIELFLKKCNFDYWNQPRPQVRSWWNKTNAVWWKIWGLGVAFERPNCMICDDDFKMEWRELSYKLHLGPLYLFGSFRVSPKRPCKWKKLEEFTDP